MTHSNPLVQLLTQSDFMTKIILAVLLGMSIICWTIFLYKLILFMLKKRQLSYMIEQVKKAKTIDELRSVAALNTHTIGGYLVVKELASLKQILEVKDNRFSLTHEDYLMLCDRTDQTINEVLYYQESYLSILSTSAAAAPLLGLLGTIWGLVHSFLNISQTQQADIVTIAPGIAEALITTLAGLLVALPSLVMFHYLHGQVRHLEQKLYLLADRVHDTMRLAFMKQ